MTDLTPTIAPKSDQLNADDLIGRTLTIKITNVSAATKEQPIAISFEGDNGKPYLPCKSMRRVLVHVWGADGKSYIGKKLTLFRDPEVAFGGIKVGGIRISNMSGIAESVTLALTASKQSRKPYTVKPLVEDAPLDTKELEAEAEKAAADGTDSLSKWWGTLKADQKKAMKDKMDKFKKQAADIDGAKNETR